jgi:glycosyltransferase involved in cell wall biosynthesis
MVGKAKVVYTPNSWSFSMNVPRWRRALYAWVERRLARCGDAIAAVSRNEAGLARRYRIKPPKLVVIHTGLRPIPKASLPAATDARSSAPDAVNIIMVARFVAQKRQEDLIAALGQLRDLNWRLILVGDGERQAVVKSAVAAAGLQDRVDFLGLRFDVQRLLLQSDIFALTSLYEGFPLSILEAMRASLPVIANDVDGNSEAIVDGETGYLIPKGDVGMLARRLRELITAPEVRARMGLMGKQRFESHFTAARMHQDMNELYQELVQAR